MSVAGTAVPGASGRDIQDFVCGPTHLGGVASIGDGHMEVVDGIRRAYGFGCFAGCPFLDGSLGNCAYGCGMHHEHHSVAGAEHGSGKAWGGGDKECIGGTL